jgi:hypothetical protein
MRGALCLADRRPTAFDRRLLRSALARSLSARVPLRSIPLPTSHTSHVTRHTSNVTLVQTFTAKFHHTCSPSSAPPAAAAAAAHAHAAPARDAPQQSDSRSSSSAHLLCRLVEQRGQLVVLQLQLDQRVLRLHPPLRKHTTAQAHTARFRCLVAQLPLSLQLLAQRGVLGEAVGTASEWVARSRGGEVGVEGEVGLEGEVGVEVEVGVGVGVGHLQALACVSCSHRSLKLCDG